METIHGIIPAEDRRRARTAHPTQLVTHLMSKYSPDHYIRGVIEVWDFIADQQLDYFTGNVVKYVCRAGYKPHEEEIDDLLKAKAYIEKKISLVSKAANR